MKFVKTLAVCAAGLSTMVVAQTERELGAHEHGSAALNVALDGNMLFIELESPWNNIVGFEHAPNTEEQKALVEDSLALLDKPMELFEFAGTDCVVSEVSVESTLSAEMHEEHDEHHEEHEEHEEHHDDHEKHEEHDEHHDDHAKHEEHEEHHDDHAKHEEHEEHHDDREKHEEHDEHHDDHAKHEDHDEHHDDHADADSTHSEVLASYGFTCESGADLSSIKVALLERWSGFVDLDVQLIGPAGQALLELNAQQMQVDMDQVR